MPDEAIYADRGLTFWHHGTLTVLHGEGSGYSVLYPILAGIPLSVGDISTGYGSLKLLQALVMSLAAAVVILYGRRLMPTRYAVLAGVLTVASPLLLYSGFVMTEVLYYPLAALAVAQMARAIETATTRDQLLALVCIAAAVLTRVQAVVLVAIFALAILVDALLGSGRRRLRRFWPVWTLIALVAVATAARPGVFGAYAGTLSGSYPLEASLRLVYYHAAYAILMVAIAPFVALVLLLEQREREPGARALIAVATCTFALVTIQVGMFSARYAPHLLGRDLAAIPPALFLVFALWLARGAPRARVVASATLVAVLAVVVAAPWNDLVTAVAIPDTMGIAIVHHTFGGLAPADIVAVGAAVLLVVIRFVPRRLLPVLALSVLAVLVATTALASNLVVPKVRSDQQTLLGSPRDWIDRDAPAPVAFVYDGAETPNSIWQQRFWNRRIRQVVSLLPGQVPGPMPQLRLHLGADGLLPIAERYAVADDRITLAGTPVAHQSRGVDMPGLTLWRLSAKPRVVSIVEATKPNGDILTSASVHAYDCSGGQLQVTLIPKSTTAIVLSLDGKPRVRADVEGLPYWNGTVPVPTGHRVTPCLFTIRGGLLLGSTRIAFVPR